MKRECRMKTIRVAVMKSGVKKKMLIFRHQCHLKVRFGLKHYQRKKDRCVLCVSAGEKRPE